MPRDVHVGSAEKAVLVTLLDNGGSWAMGDRPLWETKHWTTRLLSGLVPKQYVREVVPDKQYELTDSGVQKARELQGPTSSL